MPGRRLAALSVAVAVTLIVFAAATAGVDFRYAVPALPLLVLGTALATAPGSRIPRGRRGSAKAAASSAASAAVIDLTKTDPKVVLGS